MTKFQENLSRPGTNDARARYRAAARRLRNVALIPSAQVSLGLPCVLLPGGLHFITYFGNPPLPVFESFHAIEVVWF